MIVTVLVLISVGVAVGMMSAMFGVGGGVLMVPFIVLAFGETQHVAEGTSLAVMVPTAIVGVIAHSRRGFVSFSAGARLGAPGVLGAITGALIAHRIDASELQVYFGIFTVIVGLKVLWDGLRRRRAPGPNSHI